MAELPIHNRAGEVVAVTLIDDADLELLGRWRWSLQRRSDGTPAYVKRNGGPAGIVLLHRELFGLARGDRRGVDHRNGDGLDNRRDNLRIATQAQNLQNLRPKGKSRYRGVSWRSDTGKWTARVTVGGVTHRLGCFDLEHEAGTAAAEARRRLMPFSAEAAA